MSRREHTTTASLDKIRDRRNIQHAASARASVTRRRPRATASRRGLYVFSHPDPGAPLRLTKRAWISNVVAFVARPTLYAYGRRHGRLERERRSIRG